MEKIKKNGYVVSVSGDSAHICLTDSPECSDNCTRKHSCGIMRNGFVETDRSDDSIIVVNNTINAEKGQRVEVSIADRTLSGYGFMLFILPLILIALGAIAAYYLIPNTLSMITGGIAGLLVSILINRWLNKKVHKNYKITKILP